jgi:tRNA (uracil-5-)-methyltransferase
LYKSKSAFWVKYYQKRLILECKHFGKCGSCNLYEYSYDEQLNQKKEFVNSLLKPFSNVELDVFTSPIWHYRARAEFRIWHQGSECFYAMGNITKDGVELISQCPKVIKPIEKRMWRLLEIINADDTLSHKLFGVEFLATTCDDVLITLLYHRKLDSTWSEVAKELEGKLECKIMGRSRKQKVILSDDFVFERLKIDNQIYTYKEYENSFTQPNPYVNIQMIEWALNQAKDIKSGDLLESYCGLGNFTLPLSKYFDKVLATEISKKSINSALSNCELNNINNISFVRLSSEELTQALNGTREFRRLSHINLSDYDFSSVLVDPPRAGLDSDTIELISNIEYIIYISCNPETLARDLKILTKTHSIKKCAIFDQFPHTKHIECGVFLQKA